MYVSKRLVFPSSSFALRSKHPELQQGTVVSCQCTHNQIFSARDEYKRGEKRRRRRTWKIKQDGEEQNKRRVVKLVTSKRRWTKWWLHMLSSVKAFKKTQRCLWTKMMEWMKEPINRENMKWWINHKIPTMRQRQEWDERAMSDLRVTAAMKSDSDRMIKDKDRREIRAEEEETCREWARGKLKVMSSDRYQLCGTHEKWILREHWGRGETGY